MVTDHHVALATHFLRRKPQQQRSRDKVRSILAAAEDMLAEVGYDEAVANPEQLIERAGVTTGSFYSYFASARDVMLVLGRLHLHESMTIIDGLATQTFDCWETAASTILDAYADYYRNPVVRELQLQGLLGQGTSEEGEADSYIARQQMRLLRGASQGALNGSAVQWRVLEELGTRLLEFAFRRDPSGDAGIIAETKVAFRSYLATFNHST